MFLKIGEGSGDVAKRVMSTLYRTDRDSNEFVESDNELDKQLEGLLYEKKRLNAFLKAAQR